jgi:hypothetical protein
MVCNDNRRRTLTMAERKKKDMEASGRAEQTSMILSLLRGAFRRRAFTRRTRKPPSSSSKVTPEISLVGGRCSEIEALIGDFIFSRTVCCG